MPSDRLPRQRFATTRWSLVIAAGDQHSDDSRDALAQLCEAYWYPLYAYIRRRVNDPHEAQDLLQAFFAQFIERESIEHADPARGRFRSFLLTSLKNFLANEWRERNAVRRGGGQTILSLDFSSAESRFQTEPADDTTPEKLFERRWALTLIDQVLTRLQQELTDAGRQSEFDQLKVGLTGEATADDYEQAAGALDISPAAAKQAAYRLRKRYRELFRQEVASTLTSDDDVDDELRRLLENLG